MIKGSMEYLKPGRKVQWLNSTMTQALIQYHRLVEANKPGEAGDLVASLPIDARILLREEVKRCGLPEISTLYFDYEMQGWF